MRILYLTHRLPYAPNRGDRLRAWHILHHLAREHEVSVGSLVHDEDEASRTAVLVAVAHRVFVGRVPHLSNRFRGVVGLAGDTPLSLALLDSSDLRSQIAAVVAQEIPDLVIASCPSMARMGSEGALSSVPMILDMADADSAKWRDLATKNRFPLSWIYRREARTLAKVEVLTMRRCRATLVVNDRERAELLALDGNARVVVIGNGVDIASLAPSGPPAQAPVVVFCGVMNYGPNEEGAEWLATEVWPSVRAAIPDALLLVVGSSPTSRVLALRSMGLGIEVTGAVPDVRPYLWRAAVAAAPLHTARGVQNKVLEALGAKLPSVVTPPVFSGLPDLAKPACVVAGTGDEFARALIGLLRRSPDERRALVDAVDTSVLTWERTLAPLAELVRDSTCRVA